ncbi:MAG: sigma-70 family RNA polymerase sigma factor, partial [Cyanobacteriota bacterium]
SEAAPMAPSVRSWIKSSCTAEPLSEATVLELARRVQRWKAHPQGAEQAPPKDQRRGLRARNKLVAHNLRLIGSTWHRHRNGLPGCSEATADALQEAAIALVRAAEKFDPSRGYPFSTYASFWIRQGFGQYERQFRRMIRLPHDKLDLLARVLRLSQEQLAATGQTPSVAWLAERCGPRGTAVDAAALERLLVRWNQTLPLELDRPCKSDEGEGMTLLDQVADRAFSDVAMHDSLVEAADFPDGAATYASCVADPEDPQRSLLPLLLEQLDPTARRLIWHRYLREHPLTPRQIKRVMGLSFEEQDQLEAEALERMQAAAKEQGLL